MPRPYADLKKKIYLDPLHRVCSGATFVRSIHKKQGQCKVTETDAKLREVIDTLESSPVRLSSQCLYQPHCLLFRKWIFLESFCL